MRPSELALLKQDGHDLAVVSAWAGHKHFATTSTYYTEVSCSLMEREAGHIQKALVNSNGHRLAYESFPKSFWENPTAHKLELGDTHINTPIYGYCGLPLDQDCHKFRACYTCQSFVATIDKLPEYVNVRDELRGKQALKEQLGKKDIPNPGGWLNQAIKEGWTKPEPVPQVPQVSPKPAHQVVTGNERPAKELLSIDKLQQLSNIFNQKHE
jgi:hypothetical protein